MSEVPKGGDPPAKRTDGTGRDPPGWRVADQLSTAPVVRTRSILDTRMEEDGSGVANLVKRQGFDDVSDQT